MNVQRILLPLECSDVEQPAIDNALDMARRNNAVLHLFSVVDWGLTGWDYQGGEHVVQELHSKKEEYLEGIREKADELEVESVATVIDDRDVHERVTEYIDEHDIDLLVMATHGRSGLDRFLLGSTTERVLRSSKIPMMIVPIGRESE